MNNEPVAWISPSKNLYHSRMEAVANGEQMVSPLYTHPVNTCKHGVDDGACKECYLEATNPVKELTDEEIYELLEKYQGVELCKEVLRKAQEK